MSLEVGVVVGAGKGGCTGECFRAGCVWDGCGGGGWGEGGDEGRGGGCTATSGGGGACCCSCLRSDGRVSSFCSLR